MEPNPNPNDQQMPLKLSRTLLALVEEWRFRHRAANRNDAIRHLIRRGLEADKPESENSTK
jgi:metal-responsive CopG/Arc/MetJ family transcriptional regulator